MILKDTHTVQNDRTRFKKYVEIAREEIANG
jgi:DNA-directed RNA polymerase subunit K/omega